MDRYDRIANFMPETIFMDKKLFCEPCKRHIHPKLITGKEVYPHRKDLYLKSFLQCPYCDSYVGCHPCTNNPLGCIVGPEVKQARSYIHSILDPIWQSGAITRNQLYKELSNKLGYHYHTAGIRNMEEARQIIELLKQYEICMQPIEGDF